MLYIDIAVSGSTLAVSKPPLAENNIGTLTCRFTFDSAWEGYDKFAVFTHGSTSVAVSLDENGACEVPSQVMGSAGVVTFGVFGNSGERRINSCLADLDLAAGAYTDTSTELSPESLSAYETAVAAANTAAAYANGKGDYADEKGDAADTAATRANTAADNAEAALEVLPALLLFTNKTASGWTYNENDPSEYKWCGIILCSGVTGNMMADVVFNVIDATSGNLAPTCGTGAGVVYIYAKSEPTSTVTIPTIKVVYNP